jgi:hypothetical protein
VSLPFQGDYDLMFVDDDIVCVDEPGGLREFSILKTEYNDRTPPGYVKVVAENLRADSTMGLFCSKSFSYQNDTGKPFVSSTIFKNYWNQISLAFSLSMYDNISEDDISFNGPAATKFVNVQYGPEGISFSTDNVYAIYLYTSKFLEQWKQRPRYNQWPDECLIEEIAQSEGYIVPIGSVESENPDLEWRVSYVTAEQKLMRSLNATQAKFYVILKMICKELLGSEDTAISSYVMKNVVLWVCELYDLDLFVPHSLLDQVAAALLFLKLCLQNNHLPNYIIPGRNLIAARLTVHSKKRLIGKLSILLANRTRIFYELNIFKKHVCMLGMSHCDIDLYGKKRDAIEKLYLLDNVATTSVINMGTFLHSTVLTDTLWEYFKDKSFFEIRLSLMNIIVPEWTTLLFTDVKTIVKLFNQRLKIFLS